MEDNTPKAWSSPESLWLSVEDDQLRTAREIVRDNKGAEWSACVAIGLQVGDNVELRDALVGFLMGFNVPMVTISDAFGLSGQEAWEIANLEPISLFWCLDCGDLLDVRDRRDLLRLRRAALAVSEARPGGQGDAALFCDSCTNLRLQLHNEEQRLKRLARQARTTQLRRMPFAEYRLQPEWQARRTAKLAKAGYRCQVCGERDTRLDVHHNTYDRYGDESDFDLAVMCGRCHERYHGIVEDAS